MMLTLAKKRISTMDKRTESVYDYQKPSINTANKCLNTAEVRRERGCPVRLRYRSNDTDIRWID